jgi:antitoxin (DNA-binding transcriptional repressor) of toxin-antitoxin stability system
VNRARQEEYNSLLADGVGQEFVIAKAGRPVARLGPLARQGKKRRLGLLDGKFRIPDDFNEPLPDEVIAAFEGRRR